MPYVTGRAYGATGFPVVNVEFALQRDRQQTLICNAQSGSFQSHRRRGSFVCWRWRVSRVGDHVVTEYELVPLFDRTPDGAANGIILFDIYFRGAFVGCQRTWAQARAYIDFLQSDDNLFCKASMNPFRMMTFYKERLALNGADKIECMPHPADNALGAQTVTPAWRRICRKAAGNSRKEGKFSIS